MLRQLCLYSGYQIVGQPDTARMIMNLTLLRNVRKPLHAFVLTELHPQDYPLKKKKDEGVGVHFTTKTH